MSMQILDRYYRAMGTADLKSVSQKHSIAINWIIEAGCHDGSDTVELIRDFPKSNIFAFEPDPISRAIAEEKYLKLGNSGLELYPFGLSDENSQKFLDYVDNQRGSGTTSLAEWGTESVKTVALDKFRKLPSSGGLLWLDVEGHAVKALLGMQKTLKGVDIAKVEVQMHQKSEQRKQDYGYVMDIMAQAGLIPIKAPLHPGYFGDIYFVRKGFVNIATLIRSKLLTFQMRMLHNHVYPILNKPKK